MRPVPPEPVERELAKQQDRTGNPSWLWDERAGVGQAAIGAALAAPLVWAAAPFVSTGLSLYTGWAAANPAKAVVVDHVVGDLAKRAYTTVVPPAQRGGWRGAAYSYGRKAFSAYRGYHRSRYNTRQKRWKKLRKSLGKFAKKWRYGRGADARTRWRNTLFRLRGAPITRFMP